MTRLLLMVLTLTMCSGCWLLPDYIRPIEKMPEISGDDKPVKVLEDLKVISEITKTRELTPEEKTLLNATYEFMRYSRMRDARIDAYNAYAQERNRLFSEQGTKLRGN